MSDSNDKKTRIRSHFWCVWVIGLGVVVGVLVSSVPYTIYLQSMYPSGFIYPWTDIRKLTFPSGWWHFYVAGAYMAFNWWGWAGLLWRWYRCGSLVGALLADEKELHNYYQSNCIARWGFTLLSMLLLLFLCCAGMGWIVAVIGCFTMYLTIVEESLKVHQLTQQDLHLMTFRTIVEESLKAHQES